MRYLSWLAKIALFLVILGFAVKNTETVTVHYYLGYELQAPLVFVLLIFFAAGAAVGVLASLGFIFKQRREIVTLRRELAAATATVPVEPASAAIVPVP